MIFTYCYVCFLCRPRIDASSNRTERQGVRVYLREGWCASCIHRYIYCSILVDNNLAYLSSTIPHSTTFPLLIKHTLAHHTPHGSRQVQALRVSSPTPLSCCPCSTPHLSERLLVGCVVVHQCEQSSHTNDGVFQSSVLLKQPLGTATGSPIRPSNPGNRCMFMSCSMNPKLTSHRINSAGVDLTKDGLYGHCASCTSGHFGPPNPLVLGILLLA